MELIESVKYAKHAIKKASVYDTHREVSRFRCDIAAELRTKNKTVGRAKLAIYSTSTFELALSDSEAVIMRFIWTNVPNAFEGSDNSSIRNTGRKINLKM